MKQATQNIRLKDLFLKWLEITKSFHGLTNQQSSILALFLYYHYGYSKEITNNKILWKMVFDYDTKQLIEDELGVSNQVIQNFLTFARKKGIVNNNVISGGYIPDLSKDSTNFKIIFNFNIINE
jgi:hypothetical protein